MERNAVYDAILNIFGVFADGAPIKLNAEIKVMSNELLHTTYLLIIASPLDKTNIVWKDLYNIQKEFTAP